MVGVTATGAGITNNAGSIGAGTAVTFTVSLTATVTVAGGAPTLSLNDGGTATYVSGSGTNALVFTYTVGSGQSASGLAITGVNLPSGVTVQDDVATAAVFTGADTTFTGLTVGAGGSAPTITGTLAGQTTTSEAAVKPFSGVTVADANSGASDTLTITVTGAGGTLSGTGLTGGTGGVYTLTGTAAAITSELDALSFTPKAGSPGTSSTTNFQLSDLSSAYATATVNTTTSVVDTDPAVAVAPTITGTVAGRATTSEAAVKPFSGVTVADANSGASDTLTITVTGAGGTLSGTGLTGGTGGVYTLTGTAAAVTSELDALSFTPKAGSPGTSSTTNFQLSDLSSAYATATVNTTTSVVDTDPAVAVAPTITGTVAGRATTSEAAVKPFSGVTIADANSGASDTLTITVTGAGGTLSGTGLTGGTGGVYTLTGTAATVTSELDALSFTPKAGSPGTSSTTNFQLSDLSSAYATATVNTTTSVVDTDPAVAVAPTITGTVAGRATTSEAAVKPFSGVTIADANSGASDTLTITVTGAGGTLSGTGLTGGTGGVYTLTGTAAAITSELDALSFTPKAGSPGTSSTTNFQLSDLSSAYATATVNTTTSVVDSDPAGPLSLSVAQATALETAGGSAPSGDVVTLSDTAANIEGLTAAQIGGLKAIGVTAIAATNASVSLTSAQAVALETAGLKVSAPSGDTVTLSDTAANIDGLTPTQITGLDAIGVTGIIASGAVILSVADAMALETAGLAISDPTLSDTAANIESLTATEIRGLDAIGVVAITVTNGSVSFSVAQAIALETEGLKVSAPTGDFVTLSDTAANIATLTAAQIAGLEAIGVTAIAATNASVSLSVAQTSAVNTAGLSVSAPANDTVTEHNADGSYNVHYYGVTGTFQG